jgi:hypothetical protein
LKIVTKEWRVAYWYSINVSHGSQNESEGIHGMIEFFFLATQYQSTIGLRKMHGLLG